MKALSIFSLICAASAASPAFAYCDTSSLDYRNCMYNEMLRARGQVSGGETGVSSRPNPLGGYDYSNGMYSRPNPQGGYDYSNGVRCRPNPLGGMDCSR
jgi:hypothetical protein